MADVFMALKSGSGGFRKLVALKSMLPHISKEPQHVHMFEHESHLGALSHHPNLIQVFDAEVIEDRPTMVMQFIPGKTLDVVAERIASYGGPFPVSLALEVISQAALGLQATHELHDLSGDHLHIVHRDVSPQNILLSYDGEVKLFDFGVAVASADGKSGADLAGKTAYMSPEQCRSEGVDKRSDIFSLGIVLHELLTGKSLFKRENQIQSFRAILEEPILPPSSFVKDIPPEVDTIVMHALAKDPEDRYQDALQFHRDLTHILARAPSMVGQKEISMLMTEIFRSEISEDEVLIQKILMAPEPSESTIDLSSLIRGEQPEILVESSLDLGPPEIPKKTSRKAKPPAVPIETNEIAQQLNKARKTNQLLFVAVVVVLIAALAGIFLKKQSSIPEINVPVLPTFVEVSVSSEPSGAMISIDGTSRGLVTPATFELTAGELAELAIMLDGYETEIQRIVPSETDPLELDFAMAFDFNSPLAPIGSIRIDASPIDAQVFIDGELRGEQSPVFVDMLMLNKEYNLRLQAEGYETITMPFLLDNRETLEFQLSLIEGMDISTISVISSPEGLLTIDGSEIGMTPIENLELPAPPNVSYTLAIEVSGYQRWQRTISLQPDVPSTFNPVLERRTRSERRTESNENEGENAQEQPQDRYQIIDPVERPQREEEPEEQESNRYELLPME